MDLNVNGRRRATGTGAWRRGRVLLAGAAVGAVVGGLLTGCTSSDGVDPVPEESEEAPDPTPSTRPIGPLDALLNTVSQDGEASDARIARLERSEQIIAECMAEQGFEYTPWDFRAQMQEEETGPVDPSGRITDSVAFAAEYGYGVFTSETLAAEAAQAGGTQSDPNAERVAAMSSAERDAYYLALWGPGQGDEYAAGDVAYDWTQYGCGGRAQHESGVDDVPVFDDSPWQDLRDQIRALEGTVLTHPDLAEAQTAWVACMEEAGHGGYATFNDPMLAMVDRAQQIWVEVDQGVELDLSSDDYLTSPEYLAQQEEVAARSAEMAEVEIELAVADYTCRARTGVEDRAAQVWVALQEEFYEANRADLDAWLAAYEEFRAALD